MLEIFPVNSPEFKEYGRVLNIETNEIVELALKTPMPQQGSLYFASLPELEALSFAAKVQNLVYGELATQVGLCYGYNSKLNATEWHTSSEVNVAVTDLVLLLAKRSELENNRICSDKFKAFYLKKGECVEIYATSMHFTPCQTQESGFLCVVALPKGTNTDLEGQYPDKLMFRKNKWIIAHEENKALIERGVVSGIYGENHAVTNQLLEKL